MSEADCINCPVDHFNHLEGQHACFHCGAEAFQPEMGQSQCVCTGSGKQFQVNCNNNGLGFQFLLGVKTSALVSRR